MDAHESLLEKWSQRQRHKGKCFVKDGIIDKDLWNSVETRTLLVLKEAYAPPIGTGGGWDLREVWRTVIRKGAVQAWTIFRNSAYWCYATQSLAHGRLPPLASIASDYGRLSEALLSSAVVNIKKSDGRYPSIDQDIHDYGQEDGDLIREQVELIRPDVVICGNVWRHLEHLWRTQPAYDLVWRSEGPIFVDFWHPANRYPAQMQYYALGCILQNSGVFSSPPVASI